MTVALLKGKQSPNGLAHLISFMSWRTWISKDTRVSQKVISTSLAISKPCGVEVKLQVKIVISNPLPLVILLRTLNCLVLWRIHRQNFFVESPTSTNTSGFEHSVEVRTDAKSESGLVDGFPSMNINFLQVDTPTLFSRLFSSHDLSAGYYPVLTDACILLCWWCKNTYVWTYEGSRITFF